MWYKGMLFMLNGITIKSISRDGTYYLVKDWRKEKSMWVEAQHMQGRFMYTTSGRAIAGITSLLAQMPDYAKDKLSVCMIVNNEIVAETKLQVQFIGTEWEPKYNVSVPDAVFNKVKWFEQIQRKGYQIIDDKHVACGSLQYNVVKFKDGYSLKLGAVYN